MGKCPPRTGPGFLDATISTSIKVQWNLSKADTIGEINFILYKKVSFIQGFLNAVPIHFGT